MEQQHQARPVSTSTSHSQFQQEYETPDPLPQPPELISNLLATIDEDDVDVD